MDRGFGCKYHWSTAVSHFCCFVGSTDEDTPHFVTDKLLPECSDPTVYLRRADIFFCTVMSTEKPELANMLFPLQLCDEAAQVAELSSLVALRKGVKVLCLVGDHEQLPPHVTSKLAKTAGMSTSLFERWAKSQVTPTVRLLSGKEFSEVLIDEKVHNLQRCACWHLLAAAASVES